MEEDRRVRQLQCFVVWYVRNDETGKLLVGCTDKDGYRTVLPYNQFPRKMVKVHRLVALTLLENKENKKAVDHIDNNKSNNKLDNLRFATNQENNRNTGLNQNNTSSVKGVTYNKHAKKWCAFVKVNDKRKHLGYFRDLEDAKTMSTTTCQQVIWRFHKRLRKCLINNVVSSVISNAIQFGFNMFVSCNDGPIRHSL